MGQITINIAGSFNPGYKKTISALETGHADAVAQAIEFLACVVLPRAIEQDHELQAQGHKPSKGFGFRREDK